MRAQPAFTSTAAKVAVTAAPGRGAEARPSATRIAPARLGASAPNSAARPQKARGERALASVHASGSPHMPPQNAAETNAGTPNGRFGSVDHAGQGASPREWRIHSSVWCVVTTAMAPAANDRAGRGRTMPAQRFHSGLDGCVLRRSVMATANSGLETSYVPREYRTAEDLRDSVANGTMLVACLREPRACDD